MKRYEKYKTIFYVNVHCLKKVITSNDTENKSLQLQAKSIGQIIMMAIYELIFYCHLVLLVVICFVVIGNPSQVYAHSYLYCNNAMMLLPHIHLCIVLFKYLIVILFVLHFAYHIFVLLYTPQEHTHCCTLHLVLSVP